jgi:hypothetical protein
MQLIKIKQSLRWVFLILGSLALGSLFVCTYLFFTGTEIQSLRLQSPVQSPLYFETKEAPVVRKIAPRIVETAQAEAKPAPSPKAR